ncbi:MAG: DEAD/DEAH box helicase [Thermoleophilia bacterium]|nr:DEAD/DEAH box helicase [Thermoleophilia bacterium]
MAAARAWDRLLAGEELAYLGSVPPAGASTAPVPDWLDPAVRGSLARLGITALYTHQIDTLEAATAGAHALVATGTASGKTLAFNLPVLDALAREPHARALYLYPTKALARDQARALASLRLPFLRPALYDGDTAPDQRRQLRSWANVLLTNPDLVHVGLLPHHDRFGDLLANLRYVVVDEAHVYRGVFGSHVANVLRRLRRLAAAYGAAPRLLLASATVANPAELGERLTGEAVHVIDRDGAPRAERTVALWNPPLLDPALGLRASALGEGARLLATLVEAGLRTICFAKSRRAAELMHRFAAERLDAGLARRLSPYRAGTTPEQRREIERRLVEGELLGVTATDALEHGIDIGSLDCAISVGFPGTLASLLQQWGRAGRRGPGLAVLVATDDALDQFFMREPDALLSRRVEAAILDHTSRRVLDGHVRAAAFEAPISPADRGLLGDAALDRAEALAGTGELRRTPAGYVWAGVTYPAARVSLRSAGTDSVSIAVGGSGEVLGTVDEARACTTVHAGAIYLHLGERYRVLELDLARRVALVEPFAGDYFTQTKRDSATVIERVARSVELPGATVCLGDVSVTERVVAYQKRLVTSGEAFELVPLELPEQQFATEAVWLLPGPALLGETGGNPALLGALHAAEHALISMLPLRAMCDRWDIGGLSTNLHAQAGGPAIFVHDGHAGGIGIAERGFLELAGWVADTAAMLAGCPCERGCPSCVQSPKCGNLNEPLDRGGALRLLAALAAATSTGHVASGRAAGR